MYIAICDDQVEQLNKISELLDFWQKDRQAPLRFKMYRSAAELLDDAKTERFTLYFLDVIMSGMDGLAAAREIRSFDLTAEIVFLTSAPGFAYESYSVHALEYLLKPLREDLFYTILDRLLLREQRPQEGLTVKTNSTLVRILYSQLTYVEVNGKHIYFNLTDGSVREIFGTLKEYEAELLNRPEFMRVHRSYIVNMFQVAELSSSGLTTFSGKSLPVSRLLYPQLRQAYMDLLFSIRKE